MGTLVSINVGPPRDIEWQGRMVHTAVWKRPVEGRVMARHLNIDGDGQGDLAGHGGEHRAVMVYQIASYHYWEQLLGVSSLEMGAFGENLTVDGLADDQVCIGDRYRIGTAVFEVTQPRVTCYRVGLRMNNPQMPALLVSHRRPGFYCRVITEGEIVAGDDIVKVASGPQTVTVAEIDALLYLPGHPRDRLQNALGVPALSAGWRSSLEALLATEESTGNAGLAPSSAPPPPWTGFRSFRVAAVQQESNAVRSFVLEAEDKTTLPHPLAGQYLALRLAIDGAQGTVVRSYSLSGAPDAGIYRISVKRTAGVASQYLHDHVHVGDLLPVSAPRGSFTLAQNERPVVLLSAGIGVTPLLAMLHALALDAGESRRQVWWCYGARSGKEHPFAGEVRSLLARLPLNRSVVAYSQPDPGDLAGQSYDIQGHLEVAHLQSIGLPAEADFYLCGPTAFLAQMSAGLHGWGVDASRVHSETFGAGEALTPGIAATRASSPHPPPGTAGEGPGVSFTRSGLTVPWNPQFGSLLAFAEACDVPVRWSCRVGVCHNCESGLIGGSVAYAPEPLDRPAGGNVLLCCSTPTSQVELDL
ncbi:flavodoxin reductase family protein [Terriglobus roseus DSM 18391]|uniref:Flavodoxin reductase family protein n=1 Tax=Terriglobus roseus (strain DSM 18391 / NRRL B-41598 / KBS 63) TaxID=926566 RepID=I3ZBX4_TERRK|nr:MOSC and FAD-binding oxidoreductase domain-containing protein [Terriglobus roseus]AFL86742.1 flavodoxin reductase family protein [Terriglobus roseus DSM 18391]